MNSARPQAPAKPAIADAIAHNLAAATRLFQRGDHSRAEEICHQILRHDERQRGALQLLAAIAGKDERPAEALVWLDRALQTGPADAALLTHRGTCLKALGRLDEALAAHRAALALKPDFAEAFYNLGNTLDALERTPEAAAAFQRAAELKPAFAQAWFNAGNTLTELGQLEPALAAYRHALVLNPQHADQHWNFALAALLAGDFATGWREFEWRWRRNGREEDFRPYPQPLWRGESDPVGKTILVWAEQGFGDSLQFVRYLPAVAARGVRVVLEVQAPLFRLLERLPGVSTLARRGAPLPPFDLHCPLMSLPLALGVTPEQIDGAPYLRAPAPLATDWRTRLDALAAPGRPRVGIVWRGNPGHRNDRRRSLSLSDVVTFLDAAPSAIDWFCLQKPLSDNDRAAFSTRPNVHLLDASLNDFADSAAAIAALDLVISVDTSIAHLAGALGQPVWVLLPQAPDWRWRRDRPDSPWYASARLFRQSSPGDWGGVLAAARRELAAHFGLVA